MMIVSVLTHREVLLMLTVMSGAATLCQTAVSDDQDLLAVIAQSGSEGKGGAAARAARDELAKRGLEFLPALLTAMETPNPIAANWYRTVFQEIVARERMRDDEEWPLEFLKGFVSDTRRRGRPRRLVLQLIDELQPGYRSQWIPDRLHDPEFRFEAVSIALEKGDAALRNKDSEAAARSFRQAFENARDSGQVSQAATRLRNLGKDADVQRQLGLVTDWWLVGPFDAPDKTGFRLSFTPEKNTDLQAQYQGKDDATINWVRHESLDPLGQLNLIDVFGKTEGAVAYAFTEIIVASEQAAQLRCSADDSCLVWLNDEIVSAHEQWLNGTRFDRFITPVNLKAGRNRILVKVCQGPQHRDPEVPNNWSLHLRFCDEDGRGIIFEPAADP